MSNQYTYLMSRTRDQIEIIYSANDFLSWENHAIMQKTDKFKALKNRLGYDAAFSATVEKLRSQRTN